jgi:hypothetical protein
MPQNKKREIEIQYQEEQEQDKELLKGHNDYYILIFYNILDNFFSILYTTIFFIFNVAGIYFLWIFLHYIASHFYVKLCVPDNLIGFLLSPFMTTTPHCQGLRWIIYNAASVINNMWLLLGSWICSTILNIKNITT